MSTSPSSISKPLFPLLALAFRPLFLGGTLFSVLAIAWWAWYWAAPSAWQPYGNPIWWHAHEMIFGFGSAIIVGFLLTAVQTWTGVPSIKGARLGVLVLAWLAGRLSILLGASWPPIMVMAIDLAFLCLAAIAMAYPVLKVKQWRNVMFVPILLVLAMLNGFSHWAVMSGDQAFALQALHGAIFMITLVIAIIGGRVIPFFTANASAYQRLDNHRLLDALSLGSIISLVLCAFYGFANVPSLLVVLLSLMAAVVNGLRFARWGMKHTLKTPLLWSLHFSFLFIPVGFLVLALYGLGIVSSISLALHCFTVGAMGGIILAMISRVSLGHTGRKLIPPKAMTMGYVLILAAGLVRVFIPALIPWLSVSAVGLAGVLWVLAYGIYIRYYGPMLLAPRVDGRPG